MEYQRRKPSRNEQSLKAENELNGYRARVAQIMRLKDRRREIAGLFASILNKMDEFCEKHPAVGDLYNTYKLQKFAEQIEAFLEEKEQPREE